MAIKVKVSVRRNNLTGENIASAQVVNLQQMTFDEFCDYLSQDSTVGAADVAAVMTQLEKKLPLILGMGQKVQISQEGMTVRPTVAGSLSQTQLAAKLQAKKDAGDTTVDTTRALRAADLKVTDLTAGVAIDFSKKFNAAFAQRANFKRDASAEITEEDGTSSSTDTDSTGKTDAPSTDKTDTTTSPSTEGSTSTGGEGTSGDMD